MNSTKFNRRRFLGASAALTMAPYLRTSRAAGSLAVGFWDHWVPGANEALAKLCNEWAAKEKVDLKIDFITSQGNKLLLTIASEAQAKSGHDILSFGTWYAAGQAKNLEPVDDIVQSLIATHGAPSLAVEYLGKQDGHWIGVPATAGSQMKGPCARIDLFKRHAGIDLTKMYPAGAPADKAWTEKWTWDTFLVAAEKCHKAGFPFGIGYGQTADSADSAGALFAAYGAQLVDAKGNITVNSDATRQVLEYAKRLVQFLPQDVFAWDDASNNKWLISGKGALIMNPPSAWAVAKRDAPDIAADCWHFPNPKGKLGRLVPHRPYFWGIWQWAKNKPAAKDLMTFLSQRENVEKMSVPAAGYDIPPFLSMTDFPIWSNVEPPKGTVYNYPVRPTHDAEYYIVGSSAPAEIAVQIWSRYVIPSMVARMVQGQKAKQVTDWAKQELEGFRRG